MELFQSGTLKNEGWEKKKMKGEKKNEGWKKKNELASVLDFSFLQEDQRDLWPVSLQVWCQKRTCSH